MIKAVDFRKLTRDFQAKFFHGKSMEKLKVGEIVAIKQRVDDKILTDKHHVESLCMCLNESVDSFLCVNLFFLNKKSLSRLVSLGKAGTLNMPMLIEEIRSIAPSILKEFKHSQIKFVKHVPADEWRNITFLKKELFGTFNYQKLNEDYEAEKLSTKLLNKRSKKKNIVETPSKEVEYSEAEEIELDPFSEDYEIIK